MSKGFYDQKVIDEIRSRVDMVDLVSEYVALRKSGKSYVGLCPFHQEKTPSFHVDPVKQLFYCFGCGAGGNVFTFVMKKEGISFPEAVELLARRANVRLPVPGQPTASAGVKKRYETIQACLEAAWQVFREALLSPSGARALAYLQSRGLSREMIDRFSLGYAPDEWEFAVKRVTKAGFSAADLVAAGLAVERPGGGHYDRFRNRVIFPIYNSTGGLVGFAGRTLGDEQPKYLNSPDTLVFHKSRELYALNMAKPGIRRTGRVVIVEGYMDVIACFQHGIDYAVAGMGTALSQEQARALMLLAQDIFLCYDQDEAGQKATRRTIDVFRSAGGRTRVVTFSGAKDPDEFLRAFGQAAFEERIGAAMLDIKYIYEQARTLHSPFTVEGKLKLRETIVPVLASLDNELERTALVEEIARDWGVRKESLDNDVEMYRRKLLQAPKYKKSEYRDTTGYDNQSQVVPGSVSSTSSAGPAGNPGTDSELSMARRKAEEGIIRCLMEEPELVHRACSDLSEDDFRDNRCRELFSIFKQGALESINDENTLTWLAGVCARFGPVDRPERILKDCKKKLREIHLEELRQEMVQAEREREHAKLQSIQERYRVLLYEVKRARADAQDMAPGGQPRRELD